MNARRGVVPPLLLASVLLLAGCGPFLRPRPAPPPDLVLTPVATLPEFRDDGDLAALARAARQSLTYYERLPPERTLAFGADRVTAAAMRAGMAALVALLESAPDQAALAAALARDFVAYRATAPAGVLYTAYYVPVVEARRQRDARFRHPVLGRPRDLVVADPAAFGAPAACREPFVGRVANGRLVPYATRAEIERAGTRAAPVLAWVEDPIALFFLQIQGSGVLRFADGVRRIGFAASNGHPYVSIGKLLVTRGELTADAASMDGIRRWVAAHPAEGARLLHANPRYVFFRPLAGAVVGSLGVPVTAGRTIATDPAIYPPGALAFVRLPPGPATGGDVPGAPPVPQARLVLNQDAGAAIKGPGRVDLFLGTGERAGIVAGRLRAEGELYFLAPRPH